MSFTLLATSPSRVPDTLLPITITTTRKYYSTDWYSAPPLLQLLHLLHRRLLRSVMRGAAIPGLGPGGWQNVVVERGSSETCVKRDASCLKMVTDEPCPQEHIVETHASENACMHHTETRKETDGLPT